MFRHRDRVTAYRFERVQSERRNLPNQKFSPRIDPVFGQAFENLWITVTHPFNPNHCIFLELREDGSDVLVRELGYLRGAYLCSFVSS